MRDEPDGPAQGAPSERAMDRYLDVFLAGERGPRALTLVAAATTTGRDSTPVTREERTTGVE